MKWMEWDNEQEKCFREWLAERPPVIRDLAERFRPDVLFRIKATGDRGPIVSLSEDGTMSMAVTGQFNRVLFGKKVFGLKPEDVEECDLPLPGEDLGDTCQEKGIDPETLIPAIRAKMVADGHLPASAMKW